MSGNGKDRTSLMCSSYRLKVDGCTGYMVEENQHYVMNGYPSEVFCSENCAKVFFQLAKPKEKGHVAQTKN